MYTTPLPCDISSTSVTEWQYFFFYNNSSTFKSTESSTSSTILNVYNTDARLPFLLLVMSIFNRLEISWASDRKGTATLGNFSRNLFRNFVVPSREKLHAALPIVKPLRNTGKKNRSSVARIVAASRTDFHFSKRLRRKNSCETCSFQGMLHWAFFHSTYIATKL